MTQSPTSDFAAIRPTDLAVAVQPPHSMISRCGLPTRVPDARPRSELAGAARPVRRRQGRRDPRAAARGRRAAPTQPAPDTDVARPGVPQRLRQAAAHPATTSSGWSHRARCCDGMPSSSPAAGPIHGEHPAAQRSPQSDSRSGAADGAGEPKVGLPPNPRRARRARPPDRRVDSLEDPQGRRHRSCSAPVRTDLATVPAPRRPTRSSPSTSPTSTPSSCAASTSSS